MVYLADSCLPMGGTATVVALSVREFSAARGQRAYDRHSWTAPLRCHEIRRSACPASKGIVMKPAPQFENHGRICGTPKAQSHASDLGVGSWSRTARTTAPPPDTWDVIEAKWAAMIKRAPSGNAPRAADPLPPAVLLSLLRGHRHDALRNDARPCPATANKAENLRSCSVSPSSHCG